MSYDVSAIVGYCLFVVSEILPFVNIKADGIFHSIIIGLSNALTYVKSDPLPSKDIELANSLINNNQDIAKIVNLIESNPIIKEIIEHLIMNQQNITNIKAVQNNPELAHLISNIIFYNSDISQLTKLTQQEKSL